MVVSPYAIVTQAFAILRDLEYAGDVRIVLGE